MSGIINFGTTTGLTERNVAERYSVVHTGDSLDADDYISLDGFHAIDDMTVMAGGFDWSGETRYETDVTYSLDDSADVMIDDITVTAFEIRDLSDDVLTDTDASLQIFAYGEDSSLQLRQSNIFVGADRDTNSASLDIEGAWGTVSSLTLEATYGGQVHVEIDNDHNLSADQDGYNHGLIARDVSVLAAGEDSYAYLDLEIDNFIENLNLQTLGSESSVEVEIDQAVYGGLVSVSGTVLSDDADMNCFNEVGSNEVDLTFWDETAEKIVIDNTGRTLGRYEEDDDSIEFHLELLGDDKDLLTNVFDTMLTIEGWTLNDSISFEEDFENGSNFQRYTGTPLLELTEENFDKLLTNARNAFNPTRDAIDGESIPGVNFYFGTAGDNGYLFYDYDGVGVTGVVEFVGINNFDHWVDINNIG